MAHREMAHRELIARNMAANPPKQPEWQVVRRKCRYPDHWRSEDHLTPEVYLPRSEIYTPFQTTPTYAQVVTARTKPTQPIPPPPIAKPTSPITSPATSPPTYYLSPHSPTPLRFPPSPKFGKWKGRCFKCCRTGHSINVCRNLPKCGRCWKNGHTGNTCKEAVTKQAPMPTAVPQPTDLVERKDPPFSELLTGERPLNPPPLPTERPAKVRVYIDCDEEYHHEVKRLQQAVVVNASAISLNFEISVYKVVEWIAKANLIPEREVVIASLTRNRFLVIMPEGLAPETLIEAMPYEVWDEGISFHKWDPLEDASQ